MSVRTIPTSTPAPPARPGSPPATRDSRWPNPFHSRAVVYAALALLTLAAIPLHFSELHFHYWVDEGISVGIASHPLAQLPGLLHQDGSPPLYYVLLHFWMARMGRSEVDTHLLSVLFAMVAVPVAYWAGAALRDRATGLCSAVLTAGLPFLVTYAQETRMYSLMLLLSLVVAASFVRAFVQARRRYLPVFAGSLALALYTHNWALFLTLGALVAFAFCLWRRPPHERRALARDGMLAFGGALLLYLPWIPTLLDQAAHTGAPWAAAPTVWSLTQGTYALTGTRAAAVAILLVAGHGLLSPAGALSPSATSAQPATDRPRGPEGREPDGGPSGRGPSGRELTTIAVALGILGFGTMLIAWLYAKHTPAWAVRYLAVTAGPLILLAALGLARAGRFGLIALLLVASFWVLDPLPTSLNTKSNVASVVAPLRTALGSTGLVLSTQPEQVPVLHYYLPAVRHFVTPLGAVPDPGVVNWRDALRRFERSRVAAVLVPALRGLRHGQRIALIMPTHVPKTPEWIRLMARASVTWARFLNHDRSLRLIFSASASTASAEIASVRANLYTVR